ncbi:MAG: 2OG-Fe(II) oxygenase [Pseudomonadales bacterium]
MNEEYKDRLRTDAAAGNRFAERLLLLALLSENNVDSLGAVLEQVESMRGSVERLLLQAELACFHRYRAADSWQLMLRECCESGHPEARFIASLYHDWSGLSDFAEGATELSWSDGWDRWVVPVWHTVVEAGGVVVQRSERFAPAALVGLLRAELEPQLQASSVINPQSGKPMAHPIRVNRCAQWFPEQLGWVGKLLECRLAEAAAYQTSCGEVLTMLHYQKGHEYKPHVDCLSPQQAQSDEGKMQGGQRMMTVLFALGDDDVVGGETAFTELAVEVKAPSGTLIKFNNVGIAGEPLRASLHEGRAVQQGEKWMLSKWVREQPTPYGREVNL